MAVREGHGVRCDVPVVHSLVDVRHFARRTFPSEGCPILLTVLCVFVFLCFYPFLQPVSLFSCRSYPFCWSSNVSCPPLAESFSYCVFCPLCRVLFMNICGIFE